MCFLKLLVGPSWWVITQSLMKLIERLWSRSHLGVGEDAAPPVLRISDFTCKRRRDCGVCMCVYIHVCERDWEPCVTQKTRNHNDRGCSFFPFIETEKTCAHLSQFRFILSAFLQVPLPCRASLARGAESSLDGLVRKKPSGKYEHWRHEQGLKSRMTRRTKRIDLLNIIGDQPVRYTKIMGEIRAVHLTLQANYSH